MCIPFPLPGLLAPDQVGIIPWHGVVSSMGSLAGRLQPGKPPTWSSSPGPTSALANHAARRGKTIPSKTCPPVSFQSSFPFPPPLQRHVCTSGCECLLPSPTATPAEPTLPTKITPCCSHPSAHPWLWDLFLISSCSPFSPPARRNGLAADPVTPFVFLQRIISSGCCVSSDGGLSQSCWMSSQRRVEKQICAV